MVKLAGSIFFASYCLGWSTMIVSVSALRLIVGFILMLGASYTELSCYPGAWFDFLVGG